jgi:cytochrome P450
MRRPELVAAVSDPSRADQTVEELLRYLSVVQTGVPRVAAEECTLGDQRIARGERVACLIPSGNRDQVFGDPEDVRTDRQAPQHLAFGHGIHYCVGAPLARAELTCALPLLFRELPGLRPAVPDSELGFRSFAAVYGLDELPVTW